jgi:hypothetical protein
LLPKLRLPQSTEKCENNQENENHKKESDGRISTFESKIWARKIIFSPQDRFGSFEYKKTSRIGQLRWMAAEILHKG